MLEFRPRCWRSKREFEVVSPKLRAKRIHRQASEHEKKIDSEEVFQRAQTLSIGRLAPITPNGAVDSSGQSILDRLPSPRILGLFGPGNASPSLEHLVRNHRPEPPRTAKWLCRAWFHNARNHSVLKLNFLDFAAPKGLDNLNPLSPPRPPAG